MRGRKGGVHASGLSFICQPSARSHPSPSSERGTRGSPSADPPCALGTQHPGAVLGLPNIKVTPRANLNTALRIFHPPRGLVVNPPLELRLGLLWAQDLGPSGPALPQQAPVSGWTGLAFTPDLSPQGDGQRTCIFS